MIVAAPTRVDPIERLRQRVEQARVEQSRRSPRHYLRPGFTDSTPPTDGQVGCKPRKTSLTSDDLPSSQQWSEWTDRRQREHLDILADRLGGGHLTGDRWEDRVDQLSQQAAQVGEIRVYRWCRKMMGLSLVRCGDQHPIFKDHGDSLTATWVDCLERQCHYCGPLRAGHMTRYLTEKFTELGRPVYVMLGVDRTKASAIVAYATRQSEGAVAIATGDTTVDIYLTQARRGAHLVEDEYHSTVPDMLMRSLLQVPAYSRLNGDRESRVRPNRVLAQAGLDEAENAQEPTEAPTESIHADQEPEPVLRPGREFLDLVVTHRLATGFDAQHRISTVRVPHENPVLLAQFRRLLSNAPTPGRRFHLVAA